MANVFQKRVCVKCDSNAKLQCPACPSGQVCSYTVPMDCSQCPTSVCGPDPSSTQAAANRSTGNGSRAGIIAGCVVGGVAAIGIITFLIWLFFIKPRKSRSSETVYQTETNPSGDVEKDNISRTTHRSSTHTVHSIASTVLTRASNIIQIAYIPGVTNRATPTSPTVLVPPVPPIPMQHSKGNRGTGQDDQHFFVPGNLRDSTYSGISTDSDRTSFAPRSSIASTIYGKQAQVQTPAQTGMRAKPTVVSVNKTGGANTPPVPSIDFKKFGGRPKSSASALSVGSTQVKNANTATQARAQVVKLGSGLKKTNGEDAAAAAADTVASDPSGEVSANAINETATSSATRGQGPFSDPPLAVGGSVLGAVLEDEGEEKSEGGSESKQGERGRSPFSDEHATQD